MDAALVGFVRALRAAGGQASPAETIDAARAMALVGYADRDQLKASLGLVLAKSATDKDIHDRVFDQYFAAVAGASSGAAANDGQPDEGAQGPTAEPQGQSNGQAEDDAAAGRQDHAGAMGQPGQRSAAEAAEAALRQLIDLARPSDTDGASPALSMALSKAARQAGVDDIRFQSQQGYYTQRLLQALGTGPLDDRLRELLTLPTSAQTHATQAEAHSLQAVRERLRLAARALVGQRFDLFGRPATETFMTEVLVQRPIGRMAPADMERLKLAVARMAKRLAVRHSRRRKQRQRGQLDIRRTLRRNAGHDSAPVKLVFKERKRDRPRIVVVCDVSGSVATHVRFLLLFLYALQGVVEDLRSFAFSDRLKDVGAPLANLPFDDAMALILKDLGAGSTDYGQALVDLQDRHWNTIDRRTTVIVLGDGRSNQANPRLDIFAELAERAKRVLWLCPEPRNRWGSGDSCMLQYQTFCTQVSHCATAADLERAIDDTLAAYT